MGLKFSDWFPFQKAMGRHRDRERHTKTPICKKEAEIVVIQLQVQDTKGCQQTPREAWRCHRTDPPSGTPEGPNLAKTLTIYF